jgi:hypothetical protein
MMREHLLIYLKKKLKKVNGHDSEQCKFEKAARQSGGMIILVFSVWSINYSC